MTAHTSHRLRCDGRPAPSSEGAGPACPHAYRGEEGRGISQVRADAKDQDGWDYRRNSRGRWVDLCPRCSSTRVDASPADPPTRARSPRVDVAPFEVPLAVMIERTGFSRGALAGMVADGIIEASIPERYGRMPALDQVQFRAEDLERLRSTKNRPELAGYLTLDEPDSDLSRGTHLGIFIAHDRSRR